MTIVSLALCGAWQTAAPAISYRLTDIGALSSSRFSRGTSVNELGEVAGWSGFPGNPKAGPVRATLYRGSLTDLGDLPGYSPDEAYGVNNSGYVVGRAGVENSSRAFLHDGTMMRELSGLDGFVSEARDINNNGHVVGWYGTGLVTGPSFTRAFRHDGTTWHDLGALGGATSRGYGINDAGQTTGDSLIVSNDARHAFLHDGTTMHDLGTLGGRNSFGRGINIHGHVAGYSHLAPGSTDQHAFLHDGTMMHDLGTLGGNNSFGYAINAHGHVVGESNLVASGSSRAFLFTPPTGMINLASLVVLPDGWLELTAALDINDSGQITGYGFWHGYQRAFLLTPVPEPSTVVTAAISLLGLSFRARVRF
jgi:probable HAF family extracellular repeat protein